MDSLQLGWEVCCAGSPHIVGRALTAWCTQTSAGGVRREHSWSLCRELDEERLWAPDGLTGSAGLRRVGELERLEFLVARHLNRGDSQVQEYSEGPGDPPARIHLVGERSESALSVWAQHGLGGEVCWAHACDPG